MLNFKKTTVLKCAVIGMLALAACSKNNNDTAAPPDNQQKDSVYRLEGLAKNGSILNDSLVYQNDKVTEAWFYEQEKSAYTSYNKYAYNTDGTLKTGTSYKKYAAGFLIYSVDSLSYNGSKITDYYTNYNNSQATPTVDSRDTSLITLNADKSMALAGSKDTVYLNNKTIKRLVYHEYTFTGKNITKELYKYYYATGSGTQIQNYDYVSTAAYGDKLNPFYNVLLTNPLLGLDLASELGVFVMSYNNVTSYKDADDVDYTITSETLPGTNLISKYTFKYNNKTLTFNFKFKKIAK